jgi:hypothetical protein
MLTTTPTEQPSCEICEALPAGGTRASSAEVRMREPHCAPATPRCLSLRTSRRPSSAWCARWRSAWKVPLARRAQRACDACDAYETTS